MSRIFRIVSIAVHVIVVGVVFVAQLLAVGPLPIPRSPLTFVGVIPIAVVEPPAPPPRANAPQPAHSVTSSPDAAPIVSPEGVTPETPVAPRPQAPGIGVIEGGVPGIGVLVPPPLPPVAPPPPPPQAPIRLHSGMQAPRKIVNVDPIYPRVAQTARIEGVVILEAIVDAQGRVATAKVLRSIPLLDQAAVEAVQQWKFTPALLNGEAVPVVMTVTINFKLTDR